MMLKNCSANPVHFLSEKSGYILCRYKNETTQFQIVRISNIPNFFFERVVSPNDKVDFEASPEALLEIHSSMMPTAIISDTIPCAAIAYYF